MKVSWVTLPPMAGGERREAANAVVPATNPFGLVEALIGFAAAEVLSAGGVALFAALSGHPRHPAVLGSDVFDLGGIWIGFLGAVLGASFAFHRRQAAASTGEPGLPPAAGGSRARRLWSWLREDYGLSIAAWPDLPLGILAGLASQFVLVRALEEVLVPFVPHLFERLSGPAKELTGTTHGASLAIIGCLLCIGSPLVEECFFRGLFLRGMVGRLAGLGRRSAEVLGVVVTALFFALAHFEALEFIGLAGFGLVLGALARRTGRLGPGIVAHMTFNAVAVIAIALQR